MRRYRFYMILFLIFMSPLYAQGKILKIAVSFYDPPFVIQGADKQIYGFDIAMMEYLCRAIDYNCQLIPLPPNELIDAVEKNKVDIAVGSLIITIEHAQQVNFSLPYLVSQSRFLGQKKQADKPFNLQVLNKSKIGIVDEVYAQQLKMLGLTDHQIVRFAQDHTMIQALNKGNIDFALLDNFTANYWHIHSSEALVALGKPMAFGFGLAIAINRNNIPLLEEINLSLLKYLNSDHYLNDYDKYLLHF